MGTGSSRVGVSQIREDRGAGKDAAVAASEGAARLQQLVDEQAAVRRVATLVARGARSEEVFTAVAEGVAGLFRVTSASMGRFDADGMVTIVGAWSAGAIAFPVGGRWEAAGNDVTGIVRATGQAARLDDYAEASGPVGVHARRRLSVGGGNPDYGRGPAVGRHDRCLERTGAAPAGYRGSPGVVHGPRRDGGAPGEGRLADPRGHGLVGIS